MHSKEQIGEINTKMKTIVHIEEFFHPDAGYQVNVLAKYLAAEGYKVYIVTAELDKIPNYLTDFFGREDIEKRDQCYFEKYGVNIIRIPLLTYVSGRAIFSKSLWKVICDLGPDVLFVHGCDTYTGIKIIRKAIKFDCKIVTDNHMVDVASKNPLRGLFRLYYKYFVTPHIIRNKIPVIRLVDDEYVKVRLGIPLRLSPIISFGSDLMLFSPNQDVRRSFRKDIGIDEEALVFCYAGKLDEFKGGKLLAQALQEKLDFAKETVFIIIGNISGEYGSEVEEIFEKSANRILRFPTQKYEDLSKFYQISDIALFPKACSLSFFDVQACGLPVLSENIDINIQRCSHGNGLNFEADNVQDLREKIFYMGNLEEEKLNQMKNASVSFIRSEYDYKNKLREYIDIFEKGI